VVVFFFSPCGIEEPAGLQCSIFYTAKLLLTNETELLLITQPVACTKLKYMIKQSGSDSTLSFEEWFYFSRSQTLFFKKQKAFFCHDSGIVPLSIFNQCQNAQEKKNVRSNFV